MSAVRPATVRSCPGRQVEVDDQHVRLHQAEKVEQMAGTGGNLDEMVPQFLQGRSTMPPLRISIDHQDMQCARGPVPFRGLRANSRPEPRSLRGKNPPPTPFTLPPLKAPPLRWGASPSISLPPPPLPSPQPGGVPVSSQRCASPRGSSSAPTCSAMWATSSMSPEPSEYQGSMTQSWPKATLMPWARISGTRVMPRRFG